MPAHVAPRGVNVITVINNQMIFQVCQLIKVPLAQGMIPPGACLFQGHDHALLALVPIARPGISGRTCRRRRRYSTYTAPAQLDSLQGVKTAGAVSTVGGRDWRRGSYVPLPVLIPMPSASATDGNAFIDCYGRPRSRGRLGFVVALGRSCAPAPVVHPSSAVSN